MSGMYKFFFGGDLTPRKLWDSGTKVLGENLKKSGMQKFEHLILNLLSGFNFITIYVDPSGKEGVDVVAISPFVPQIIIAGATIGVLKDDVQKLTRTADAMHEALPELTSYRVLPVLFTRLNFITPVDRQSAAEKGIAILTLSDTENLITMQETGRTANDCIEFLYSKVPKSELSADYGHIP